MLRANKRIQKELARIETEGQTDGITVKVIDHDVWHIKFEGPRDSLYSGETFTLKVKFNGNYPIECPEVTFFGTPPVHNHIYSNGHICLNILGDDWSPALTVKSICLSIISMLASATVKTLPHDNDSYVRKTVSSVKQTRFYYHDDNV